MISTFKLVNRLVVVAAIMALVSVPAFSMAATYAYVNQEGEVRTVTANDAMTALRTAPNIDEHSGVLLLDSPEDNATVGNKVPVN
jgi:hypothetical protein